MAENDVNSSKKKIFYVLDILRKYSDEDHPITAQEFGTGRHRLHRLHEQNLFEAQCSALVHGEIHPVHEDPVVGLSLCHTVLVQTTFYIVHECHHAGPHLADEVQIGSIQVVVVDRLKPIERIVHDGIDMSCHWVLAT